MIQPRPGFGPDSAMAWRASFPRSRLPASIEFSIKLVCVWARFSRLNTFFVPLRPQLCSSTCFHKLIARTGRFCLKEEPGM